MFYNLWIFSYILAILLSTRPVQAQNLRVGLPFNQRNRLVNLVAGQLVANQRQNILQAYRRVRPRIGGGWGPLLGPIGERLDVYPYNTQGRMMALSDNGQNFDRNEMIARIYGPRAEYYDASFHPLQAQDYIKYAALKPGQNVLDLACGTGLVALLAKAAVGPLGRVMGVDITAPMLAKAELKSREEGLPVLFINYDVTKLSDLWLPYAFDVITCASAFVLLENRTETVKGWTKFLKPGGRIVLDVPIESTQYAGQILEKTARKLGVAVAFENSWITGPDALKELLESAGLSARVFKSKVYGSKSYDKTGGLEVLDGFLNGSFAPMFRDERFRPTARELFLAEFDSRANAQGMLKDDIQFYVGIGTKSE